jgi:hypothetical protein
VPWDDAPEILWSPIVRSEPREPIRALEAHCPACGAAVEHEKCKVVCRSDACVYRIISNCSEY